MPGECETLARWLAEEGFDAVRTSNIFVAAGEMQARPFDLLVADAGFAFKDGLIAASRDRLRNPTVPTIVIGEPDGPGLGPIGGATWVMNIARPVDKAVLMCTISMALIDERPVRRSPRKRVNRVRSIANGVPAYLVDVSKEGMRVEIPRDKRSVPPPHFTLRVPLLGVGVMVQRMWTSAPTGNGSVICGAALTANTPRAEQAWRAFIDTIPAMDKGATFQVG